MKKLIIPAALLLSVTAFPALKADPAAKVIATVVERTGGIYVYNEKGTIIATLNKGSGPKDGLQGYTEKTVSIRRGSAIYVYNANGTIISTLNAK
jgi:hypothetical protein